MLRNLWRIGLGLVLLGGVGIGCNRQAVHTKPPPPDPLLISKKPVEGKASAVPEATVRIEPPLPPVLGGDQWAATASRSVKAP